MIVIGTGLIGTSVALAARRAGVTVFLSDRDPVAVRVAEALGAGLAQSPQRPVDLAVLAVPPAHVGPVIRQAQSSGLALSYTDVASVKGELERIVLRSAPKPSAYVGGHPMAGRELSGPLAASAELFAGRSWVLTPSPVTDEVTTERAKALALLCGGIPVLLSSREHDETVALTSHLPHLMASLLAARFCDAPAGAGQLAGQGLRDVTRIAAGDPALWADIVRANALAVAVALRGMHTDLSRLLAAVEDLAEPGPSDRAAAERLVTDVLRRGVRGVTHLRRSGSGAAVPDLSAVLRVVLRRHPGDLARLLSSAATFEISAEQVAAEIDTDGAVVVRFPVPVQEAELAEIGLRIAGWEISRDVSPARNHRRNP
ncbi:prephenate dehydrogenase [Actinoplanes cyaneus]|nr:prephenate dehydrogenase [Actinoplanes cyaneus]